MTNLFGPGSFGCARPAAVRPAFSPENGAGTQEDWWQDCTSPLARDGTELRAGWMNKVTALLRSLVNRSSVTASNLDDDLLTRAVRSQSYNYFAAPGGTANDLTITPAPAVAALADIAGMPVVIKTGVNPNTGAMTLAVSGLAATAITWPDGTALVAGDVPAATTILLRYDGTAFRMELCLSPTQLRAAAFRLKQPYLGFHGDPLTISIPNNTQTLITGYTGLINNLPGAAQSGGVITIGTTGFYQVTANMQSLLSDYSGGAYSASITVSKVDGSNAPLVSVAAVPIEVLSSNLPSTRAAAASGIAKLVAGDRIGVFFAQNRGSAQSVSISLDVEFRGV